MKNLESLNLHLCAIVRDDVAGHERLLVALETQEAAVHDHDPEALAAATELVANELEASAGRGVKRLRLMRAFAERFGVAGGAVTLGSIAARLGESGATLAELRVRLKDLAQRVADRNRRVASLVAMHRHVTNEILEGVLADGDGNPVHEQGVLLDAEV
jgi:hypothetical protein